jgi:purine-cytosine permease-like protein
MGNPKTTSNLILHNPSMSEIENTCHTQCEMKSHRHHNDITQVIPIFHFLNQTLAFHFFHFGIKFLIVAICSCVAPFKSHFGARFLTIAIRSCITPFTCIMFFDHFMFWKNYWVWQHELEWLRGSFRNICTWHWIWLKTIPTPSTQPHFLWEPLPWFCIDCPYVGDYLVYKISTNVHVPRVFKWLHILLSKKMRVIKITFCVCKGKNGHFVHIFH